MTEKQKNEELLSLKKKNCINDFINHYSFLLFPCFLGRNFPSPWNFSFFQTFSFLLRPFLFSWHFSFLVRIFLVAIILSKIKISGQPYKKDLAGYVAFAECCKQDFFMFWKKKKLREGRNLESNKALVSFEAYDWYCEQGFFIV